MRENVIKNGEVRIHVAQFNPNNSDEKLVIIPGLSESHHDYIELAQLLPHVHTHVITMRGRGDSDAPIDGYRLEDHIADIETVIDHLGLNSFHLFGFSRGCAYTLGFATKHPQHLKSLTLGDYPAVHTQLPPGFVEYSKSSVWRGKSALERMPIHAIEKIQKDSEQVEFWNELKHITCPTTVIRGGDGGLLSEEDAQKYVSHLLSCQIITFEKCDHNLFDEEHILNVVDVLKQQLSNV